MHASTFAQAFFFKENVRALSKIWGEKCCFCLHCFDCLKRIWIYSKTALNQPFFGASSISRAFASQSWQETRHWNTWHFSSSMLRKHYIFWKVKRFIKMLCSVYKYCLGGRLGYGLAVAGFPERLPALLAAPASQDAEASVGLAQEGEFNKGSFPGQLMWCLSLFIEWIKMPVFLCVISTQGNWILGDAHRSRRQNVGDPVAFALPWIGWFLFCWRMPSVWGQAHILSLSPPSLQGIIRHSTYKSSKSSEVFSCECFKKFT